MRTLPQPTNPDNTHFNLTAMPFCYIKDRGDTTGTDRDYDAVNMSIRRPA